MSIHRRNEGGCVVGGRKILKYFGWGICILAGLFILIIGVIFWFVSSVGSDFPAPEIISKHPSPDHRHEAVVYTYNCGPWDDWVYHLSGCHPINSLSNMTQGKDAWTRNRQWMVCGWFTGNVFPRCCSPKTAPMMYIPIIFMRDPAAERMNQDII
jgi:hypothetical protein